MTDNLSPANPVISLRFDDFANLLLPLGILNSPSELHGLLCGKLAGGARLTETSWLLDAVEFLDFTQAPDEKVRIALTALLDSTRDQLQGDFSLKLMLPDDDSGLGERVSALSQWCHGFLTGFGSAGVDTANISEEVQDMLRDFASIVQIQADEDEADAESDYMEVTEYVRMVVNALYLEFAPEPGVAPANAIPSSETLH